MVGAKELFQGLWESLQRAGEHLSEEAILEEEEQGARAVFPLRDVLPAAGMRPLRGYIRGYIKAAGWSVKSLRIEKRYIELVCEPPAASSA